jgi:hypothetical protein
MTTESVRSFALVEKAGGLVQYWTWPATRVGVELRKLLAKMPLLIKSLGVSYIRGLQGNLADGVVATENILSDTACRRVD